MICITWKQFSDLKNRIIFLNFHKLSPVNLTWLSQVYGKMFFLPIYSFVLENIFLYNIIIQIFNFMADVIAML